MSGAGCQLAEAPPLTACWLELMSVNRTSVLQKLTNIKGLSEAKVEKLLEASKKVLPSAGWVTGTTALQKVSLSECIGLDPTTSVSVKAAEASTCN